MATSEKGMGQHCKQLTEHRGFLELGSIENGNRALCLEFQRDYNADKLK